MFFGVKNNENTPHGKRQESRHCVTPEGFVAIMMSPAKHHSSSRLRFASPSNHNNYYFHQQVSYDDDDLMANEMIDESPTELAMLLTSVASIAKREIEQLNTPSFMDDSTYPCFPNLGASSSFEGCGDTSRMYYPEVVPSPPLIHARMHIDDMKTRAVSIDIPHCTQANYMQSYHTAAPEDYEDEAIPTLLQLCSIHRPSTSPICISSMTSLPGPPPLPLNMEALSDHTNHQKKCPRTMVDNHTTSLPEPTLASLSVNNDPTKPMKIILRKRLNWKNYPQLEDFLIANREEYLRHSALNYTMQQKKYNNCLTLSMIKLAAKCGYCFDNTEFSFVTVRDRIRCYYKSYVQSMKKRGVLIGYAAWKAGLVTKEELEETAHMSVNIHVPK